ncbi:hypothetical protein C0992_005148 [Termitomyces sp. T32_za158]|nr:hypothetical protein C0992_005148 [Termitomyces sp. T32_za158]
MVFLESALESKLNPLVAISRSGSLGLSGFVNKFNAEPELLDDLNDHWTARIHKKERNYLIERMQKFALSNRKRVTFLSGDVHCAAVGILKTLKQKGRQELAPQADYRYMVNVVTSKLPCINGSSTFDRVIVSRCHCKHTAVSWINAWRWLQLTKRQTKCSHSHGFFARNESA